MQSTFEDALHRHGIGDPRRDRVTTLQVNVGKLCNMACHHCHVDAGPKRKEIMSGLVADRLLELLRRSPAVEMFDLTGGAPELNPHFRRLVDESRALGKAVIDRCNLTVFFEPGMEDLPEFLSSRRVRVVASLPCYQPENVEKQRGKGAFDKSIRALRKLNDLGYATDPELRLDLVYNPVGPFLPPAQSDLEARYRVELARAFGIRFDRLVTITNMPIRRFAGMLRRTGQDEAYASLLVNHFNPAAVGGLMCRSLVSVSWDGNLYDCDFNQMVGLGLGASMRRVTLWDVERLDELSGRRIATDDHCFGCTAGSGSSCGGALAESRS